MLLSIPTPPPTAHDPAAKPFDAEAALALVQQGLDHALAWPRWTAFALLIFAFALMLLGRHGQRLLAGATLALTIVLVSIFFFRVQAPDADWPGLVAVIGGGAALALGIALPGWTTALISAIALGALGGFFADRIAHAPWLAGALPGALLGIFMGLANHLFWGLWMPPLFAAFSTAIAACKLLGPHREGAAVPQLVQAPWALALFGTLLIAFIAVSLEREHLRKKRLAARTKAMDDASLRAKMQRDRERMDKYLGVKKKE